MTAPLAGLINNNLAFEIMRAPPKTLVVNFFDAIQTEGIDFASITVQEVLDGHVLDAFIAAAAAKSRLAVVSRNPGEFRNTGVETLDAWTGGHL